MTISHQISRSATDLHPTLWLWLPLATFAAQFTVPVFLEYPVWLKVWESEYGFIENMTVVFCLVALVYTVKIYRLDVCLPKGIKQFVLLSGAAMFLLAGEELSWGQWYFLWETPEAWKAVNLQDETNLHNLSRVFSKYPRHVITLLCFVAGVIAPFLLRRRQRQGRPVSEYWRWLLPTLRQVLICLIVAFVTMPTRVLDHYKLIEDQSYWDMAMPSSEFREYFIAVFFMVYFISLYTRITNDNKSVPTDSSPG